MGESPEEWVMLHIERIQVAHQVVLRVEGDIDEAGVKELRIALVDCLRDGQHHVVVNLTGMRFISYMGVGVLVERLRQFKANKGSMKLVGPNMYTQRLFRMTGVTNLFEIHESEDAAIDVSEEAA